jgi:hypothetical protein
VNPRLGVPVNALGLVTIVQMLLGLINLGSTSAFTAFVSVGVQALALAYAIPIAISLLNKRDQVLKAKESRSRRRANRQRGSVVVDCFRDGAVQHANGVARNFDHHELRKCRSGRVWGDCSGLVCSSFEEM